MTDQTTGAPYPPQVSETETPSASAPAARPPQGQTASLPGNIKPPPEEVLVEWSSLSRPHKQRKRQYFTTIAILVVLISAILFFAGQLLPIAVVLTVAFLVYVLEMVPPTQITHRITTYGIRIEDTLYYWEEMGRFWFTERYGFAMLNVEVGRFPWRLTLLIADLPQDALQELLSEVLVYGKPQPTFFEQVADRLQQLIPLE